jgi:hypothetical protein
MKIILFIFQILCLTVLYGSTHADSSNSISENYISLALQGDLSQAESLFSGVSPETGPISDFELSQRFQTRFIQQSEGLSPRSGDATVDAIVSAYRKYWVLTLMRTMSIPEGEDFLESSLHQVLLGLGQTEFPGHSDNVYERIGEILDEKGYYYLDTPAPPLRDLFLWKKEENKNYTVRLTDRKQKVRVTFMTDLVSMGWKQYATLGLVSTTGWVEGDRLYCVSWAYDRSSENFEVSYLKHESRHLADLDRYPTLQSADLEYRAKLTELAFASTSQRRLLDDFTTKSALNPDSPHSYANYRVTREVYRKLYDQPFPELANPWQEASTQSVRKAARDLLQRNTEILQASVD